MIDRRQIDASNPEALAAWTCGARLLVDEIRALADDATMPRGKRFLARKYLRKLIRRNLRSLEARLDIIAPSGPAAIDGAAAGRPEATPPAT